MRQILYTLIFTLIAIWSFGQRVVDKTIEVKKSSELKLKFDFADSIKVTPSPNNNLVIKVVVIINDNQHNDKFELKTYDNSEVLTIEGIVNDMDKIKVPCNRKNGSHYYNNDNECITMDIYYEIQVPQVEKLSIKTISGDITIKNLVVPMKIESKSGFIDMNISSRSNAEIFIKTVTGGVYTNHEINKEVDKCKTNPANTSVFFKLNDGNTPIELKTISSDIFLRKM
jgi:hypothetical protein